MGIRSLAVVVGLSLVAACSSPSTTSGEAVESSSAALSFGAFPPSGPTTVDTPIGIAIDLEDGQGVPLSVRAGQLVYINQIDMRAAIDATTDEGVRGLETQGAFSSVPWQGLTLADQSFEDAQNADGTWTRRRFYREAAWMNAPSGFFIEQLDASGRESGLPLIFDTGSEFYRTPNDTFFVRRMRAIQWVNDCAVGPSPTEPQGDCTAAASFTEEALVELRYTEGPLPGMKIGAHTTQLRVHWSFNFNQPYIIPVTQVAKPQFDYGFAMDIEPITPAAADGTYAPGQAVSFRFTLLDGSGNRLHPVGSLPSYEDYLDGNDTSGIVYYNFFQESYATYYRRKHHEHHLIVDISGPAQDIQPTRHVTGLTTDVDPVTEDIITALPARDGFYGAGAEIPSFANLLGGPATWVIPPTDVVTFDLPSDAAPGTYLIAIKGRREYLGQEIPTSKVIQIQVGTPTPTDIALNTGGCESCHNNGSDLSRVNHGLSDRRTCSPCHAPLTNELEGPIYVRLHFIHSRSERFDQPTTQCNLCHLDRAGIDRTSKSACLSCHKSYSTWHIQQFGPIQDMYIGGSTESFAQCTSTCHTNHPNSGL
jgi:hypothetical protein